MEQGKGCFFRNRTSTRVASNLPNDTQASPFVETKTQFALMENHSIPIYIHPFGQHGTDEVPCRWLCRPFSLYPKPLCALPWSVLDALISKPHLTITFALREYKTIERRHAVYPSFSDYLGFEEWLESEKCFYCKMGDP